MDKTGEPKCRNCGHAVEWGCIGVMGSGGIVYTIQGTKETRCNYCIRAANHPLRLFWRRHAPRFLVAKARAKKCRFGSELPAQYRPSTASDVCLLRLGPARYFMLQGQKQPAAEVGEVFYLMNKDNKLVRFKVEYVDDTHLLVSSEGLKFAVDFDPFGGWKQEVRLLEFKFEDPQSQTK